MCLQSVHKIRSVLVLTQLHSLQKKARDLGLSMVLLGLPAIVQTHHELLPYFLQVHYTTILGNASQNAISHFPKHHDFERNPTN